MQAGDIQGNLVRGEAWVGFVLPLRVNETHRNRSVSVFVVGTSIKCSFLLMKGK